MFRSDLKINTDAPVQTVNSVKQKKCKFEWNHANCSPLYARVRDDAEQREFMKKSWGPLRMLPFIRTIIAHSNEQLIVLNETLNV